MDKLISLQRAIDALKELTANGTNKGMVFGEDAVHRIEILPSVQPKHCAEVGKKVLIDRQEALEAIRTMQTYKLFAGDDMLLIDQAEAQTELMGLPSAQPDIIRCPDCYYNDGTAYCELHFRNVKAKDFCSWAERRRG